MGWRGVFWRCGGRAGSGETRSMVVVGGVLPRDRDRFWAVPEPDALDGIGGGAGLCDCAAVGSGRTGATLSRIRDMTAPVTCLESMLSMMGSTAMWG